MKSLKPSVYIETTVASYLTARPTRDLIMMARQQSSEIWWQRRLPEFSPVISQLVLDEAGRGDPEAARRRLRVLRDFPILEVTAAAFRLAAQFVRPEAMPDNAKDDALHVALCAIHGISYLLTWNFRHIANAEIRRVLAGICTEAGYGLPTICTPDELLKGDV